MRPLHLPEEFKPFHRSALDARTAQLFRLSSAVGQKFDVQRPWQRVYCISRPYFPLTQLSYLYLSQRRDVFLSPPFFSITYFLLALALLRAPSRQPLSCGIRVSCACERIAQYSSSSTTQLIGTLNANHILSSASVFFYSSKRSALFCNYSGEHARAFMALSISKFRSTVGSPGQLLIETVLC